jgi:hypothetical protein
VGRHYAGGDVREYFVNDAAEYDAKIIFCATFKERVKNNNK